MSLEGEQMSRDMAKAVPTTESASVTVEVETPLTTAFSIDGLQMYNAVPVNLPSNAQVIGSSFSQLLEVNLAPGEIFTCEPGTFVHSTKALGMGTDMGDCSQACTRCCCAQESFFRLVFENKTREHQLLGISPRYPSAIIPVDLERYSGLTIKSGVFIGAFGSDWRIEIRLARSLSTGCCGGQGFVLNSLHGTGYAFISAGGTVMTKHLADGEELLVDTSALVAFEKTVKYSIKRSGDCTTMCCGGAGLFNTKLTGPGMIIIETMPFEKLVGSTNAQQSQS